MGLTDKEMLYVEDVGLFFESHGFARIAGRILGCLMICQPPEQSLDELHSDLGVSKSSVSSMTRWLVSLGLIEKASLPSDRKAYFRMKPGGWSAVLERRLKSYAGHRALADRGLALLADQGRQPSDSLLEMREAYGYLEDVLPIVLEEWKKDRQ